jgi:hypothetical protein
MSDNAGGGAITYRVDKRAAKKQSFYESTNHESLGLVSGEKQSASLKAY